MERINSLSEIIKFNSNFKTAINLYLSLNKSEKVLSYIPTKSSVNFMGEYLNAVLDNKEQATLLVGPYGKGKSHLLLVILAILSMERTAENSEVIRKLINSVRTVDEIGDGIAELIEKAWQRGRFLPVLIVNNTSDLNQSFLYALDDALKRDALLDLVPDTYYSIALEKIDDWNTNYIDTYKKFEIELLKYGKNISELKAELKLFSKEALNLFKAIYPKITAGSDFNPMATSEVLPLYKSISDKLVEEYGYSGIYIVFDEFSKFIESQDGTATGMNMKLLQDICELATDSTDVQIFFTMVTHKSIKEYGKYLSSEIINSFTGIEGRIIEKYFVTSSKNNYELIKNAIIKDTNELEKVPYYISDEMMKAYYQLPIFRSSFLENEFNNTVFKGCYPLNPIASYLLLNISEKVAQNERTLFTFISNDESHSMARFVAEHSDGAEWSIGADLIYDYFSPLFKKEILNEHIHNIWLSAEYSIEKCEIETSKKILKALAIVLIVNKEDEIPASKNYLKLCVEVDDADKLIDELENEELIYIKKSTGTYTFKTRAGSELKTEIKRQRELKKDNVNYSKTLLNVTGRYHIVPRRYNTEKSMTRYFVNEFMNTEGFLSINSSKVLIGEKTLDGKVITLYSFNEINQQKIQEHVLKLADRRLLVVCPQKSLKAQKQLKDFEIIQELKENQIFIKDNDILKKELPLLLEDLSSELDSIISNVYEEDEETKVLYFDGTKINTVAFENIEQAVNNCCENVYFCTPIINNEMVNRNTIGTAQTKKARINIIQAILTHSDTPEYYKGSNQEATVYRSLFCVTKVIEGEPSEEIKEVTNEINKYIDSCSDIKNPFITLLKKLSGAPYGMRIGLIPFYVAYVFANRREDIIVYFADKEVQITADIIVNMCEKPEDYSVYVSKADLQKEKYITELNALFNVTDNRNLSTNRIKNIFICMQRWFRALPQASRNTIDLDRYVTDESYVKAMKKIKKEIQKIEFNPFEILFVDFPNTFGTTTLEDTFRVIATCKTFYDDYFRWIEEQAISIIYNEWDPKRKLELYHTLKEWYEKQSKHSKQGLFDGKMTSLMSCIETLNVYSDSEIVRKIAKAVTDVYLENWNTGSLDDFKTLLEDVKHEIELKRDESSAGEFELIFTGRNGELINKLYSHADESAGSVLRNIIEDTLDEYDDLSVNDRVSILLEMIEKIIK